jgi:hypothetical protein
MAPCYSSLGQITSKSTHAIYVHALKATHAVHAVRAVRVASIVSKMNSSLMEGTHLRAVLAPCEGLDLELCSGLHFWAPNAARPLARSGRIGER